MKEKNKIFKFFLVFVLILQMLVSSSIFVFAVEEDYEIPVSDYIPEIQLMNGPVFNINAGSKNEIELLIKNTSIFVAREVTITTVLTDVSSNPFIFEIADGQSNMRDISSRASKQFTLIVDADKTAEAKTYSVDLTYTYFNTYGKKFTNTNTIYLKIQEEAKAEFSIQNFDVKPSELAAGESGELSAEIFNSGDVNLFNVSVTLDGLDAKGISVKNGSNTTRIEQVIAKHTAPFTFEVATDPNMESGNYPITIMVSGEDDDAKHHEYQQQFFVNVGGSASGKPSLQIINMAEPTGIYGVNENFSVTFDLSNVGEGKAEDITVSAIGVGEGGVVPKSSSIQSIKTLESGEVQPLSFTFAGTSASKTQNYSIEFTVTYFDSAKKETTFKQYAGVNINNPEEDEEDEDKEESKPKIIISNYECNPMIVTAGKEFDLMMTFQNTHTEKAVKNIKMFLTLEEETSTDNAKTGNIFTPVDSSNTFYFDSIPAKGTANKSIRLYAVPDAQPKTYTLTVNFEYEDLKGKEYTATELLGINVQQSTQFGTGDIYIPEMMEIGNPVNLSFEIYNTGKVTLNNLTVKIDGDVQTQSKTTYLGNLESGNSTYYDSSFVPMTVGEIPVNVIISYDDPSGETHEEVHEFNMSVTEPVMMDDEMMGMNNMEIGGAETTLKKYGIIAGVVIGIVVLVVIIVIVLKKRKAKKEELFLMEDDDDEVIEENER